MLKIIKEKLKKNLEIFGLVILVTFVGIATTYFNYKKKVEIETYNNFIENIYFKKTIKHIISNLEPKFRKIKHKIKSGETFDKILESYSIDKKQILKIKSALQKIGCPGLAGGGRAGFQDGTTCFNKGVEKLKGDPTKLSPGDQANLRTLGKSAKAVSFLKNVFQKRFLMIFTALMVAQNSRTPKIVGPFLCWLRSLCRAAGRSAGAFGLTSGPAGRSSAMPVSSAAPKKKTFT